MNKFKLFLSIKLFLQRLFLISFPPNAPQSSSADAQHHHLQQADGIPDPEMPVAASDAQQHHQQLQPVDVPVHNEVDWPAEVIGFCLSWAVAIALLSHQIHSPLPISFQFPSHAVVIAVTLLFVSKFMYPKSPEQAQVLEDVGVVFEVTAFFFAITMPFPLCLELIYWTIFALGLLAIFICYRH